MRFTLAVARRTSIVEFRSSAGGVEGGVVLGANAEAFSVVSFPRYGDTVSRRFRYDEVVEVLSATPRRPVELATFSRLMGGGSR